MVTCTHCYELVSKANRRALETCPFCFHVLPEPEATPAPEPEMAQEYVPYVDPTIAAMQSAQAAASAAPVKKAHHTVAIVAVVAVVLGVGGWFLFGRGGGGGGGADKPKGGLNPKLVPSLKNLNKQVLAKTEAFFQKTCKPFHGVDYNFETSLVLNKANWKSLIEPGSGSPSTDKDWYLCPIKILDVRSKADMKVKVETRFLSGGLFGSAKSFGKVALEGQSLKAMPDYTLPTQETIIDNWSDVKDVFHIRMGFLSRAPEPIRALNGSYRDFSLRSGSMYVAMHGTRLVQTEAQSGNKVYGKFEALVPGWFGDSMSKELRDWGTGCNNDVTEQFRKILQDQVDKHEDIEEFKDSPELKAYLDNAEKAGRALCEAMPKVWKIIELYDQGKAGEVPAVQAELKAALEAAKKTFQADLGASIDAIAAKK